MADIPDRAKNEPFFAISITLGMVLEKEVFPEENKPTGCKGKTLSPLCEYLEMEYHHLTGTLKKKPDYTCQASAISGQAFSRRPNNFVKNSVSINYGETCNC